MPELTNVTCVPRKFASNTRVRLKVAMQARIKSSPETAESLVRKYGLGSHYLFPKHHEFNIRDMLVDINAPNQHSIAKPYNGIIGNPYVYCLQDDEGIIIYILEHQLEDVPELVKPVTQESKKAKKKDKKPKDKSKKKSADRVKETLRKYITDTKNKQISEDSTWLQTVDDVNNTIEESARLTLSKKERKTFDLIDDLYDDIQVIKLNPDIDFSGRREAIYQSIRDILI